MKILLVGEYSRLHNSLKEGLIQLGHEVSILGFSDEFKNFPIDFLLQKKWDSGFQKKIKLFVFKIFGFDITSYLTYRQFKKIAPKQQFDVVQLINENCFYCQPNFEKKILQLLFKNNSNVFLLSSGFDYTNVKYCFENQTYKSPLQPYFEGKISIKDFENALKFRLKPFENLHHFINKNCKGIIATDLDYHLPLLGKLKYLGMIPNPINVEKIAVEIDENNYPIQIFHGINKTNYYKKGNDFFAKALEIIKDKYHEKVAIKTTINVPYDDYIKSYNAAQIVLDQVHAHDQGYNALEAMAKGKVVFTGAETVFEKHYNLNEKVAINALPDVAYLVEQLSLLIENPDEIIAIGKRARAFIEKEHHYLKIAEKYLEIWGKSIK